MSTPRDPRRRPTSPQREENPGEASETTRLGETDDPIYPARPTPEEPTAHGEGREGPVAVPRPDDADGTTQPVEVDRPQDPHHDRHRDRHRG